MTERHILQLLIKINQNANFSVDYAKLHRKAVAVIAQNVTDILYESLKQKSSASNIKRENILRFLNILCETTEPHFSDNTNDCLSSILCDIFKSNENEEIGLLFEQINNELNIANPADVTDNIIAFCKLKNMKQKARSTQLEVIKINDERKLVCKFNVQIRKNISYYEIEENFIQNTLANYFMVNKSKIVLYGEENRERQIKLAYSLINIKHNKHINILDNILQNLSNNNLCFYEENFLMNFWTEYIEDFEHEDIFLNCFFFVIEIVIIKYGHKLLSIQDEEMAHQIFANVEDDMVISKLRKFSKKHPRIHFKIKSLLYELYCFSYCNNNILKFCNSI